MPFVALNKNGVPKIADSKNKTVKASKAPLSPESQFLFLISSVRSFCPHVHAKNFQTKFSIITGRNSIIVSPLSLQKYLNFFQRVTQHLMSSYKKAPINTSHPFLKVSALGLASKHFRIWHQRSLEIVGHLAYLLQKLKGDTYAHWYEGRKALPFTIQKAAKGRSGLDVRKKLL